MTSKEEQKIIDDVIIERESQLVKELYYNWYDANGGINQDKYAEYYGAINRLTEKLFGDADNRENRIKALETLNLTP